jgi:hypothetical protein
VAILKVKCPWKIGGRESGREPCSQTPTFDTPATAGKQATAGMLAAARIPAATGKPAVSVADPGLYLCDLDPPPLIPPPHHIPR